MNAKQVVQIFKALMQGPSSRSELAERTGANIKAVGKLLSEMRANKMIYVIGYSNQVDGRYRAKIYSFGEGEDVPPKPAKSQAERDRSRHAKKAKPVVAFIPKTTFASGKGLWS